MTANFLFVLFNSLCQPCEVSTISIPVLQMRNPSLQQLTYCAVNIKLRL